MSLQELLNELAEKGVQIQVEENNLRIRAPKNTLSESNRSQLTEYKEEILKLLQQQSSEEVIKPISRDFPLDLSLEQERLWLANQILSKKAVYNLVQAIQLKGNLELSFLEKSINFILKRHETLQTTFTFQDGDLIQVINDFSCNLAIENCHVSEINLIANEESQKTFDLEFTPLWRFRLFKIEESEHILLLVFHHLIGDISSISIFIKELAELYHFFYEQKNPFLLNLSIQYADFAFWQRQEVSTEKIQQQLTYWEHEFTEIPQQLTLPYDYPKSNVRDLEGVHKTFRLPKELWLGLKQFSQQQSITPATVLLTAFAVLLYRISQQEDIVIGFPTSGRFHSQLESLIGFFAYPLPLRINLSNCLTFQDLLKKVKDKNIETTKNQNIPFSQILKKVKPQKSSGLFQVLFSTFLGKQLNTVSLPELTFTLLPEASRTPTDLDLLWSLYEVDEELNGVIGYNKNLFELETVEELIQAYCNIIKQFTATPELAINSFQLTEKLEEKRQIPNLVIAATFTAEPITNVIDFWLKELNLTYKIKFSPYNQVFQQLLDPESFFRKNLNGINIILIRFEDWFRFEAEDQQYKSEKSLQDFILSLQELSRQSRIPLIVCLCPSSPNFQNTLLENELSLELGKLPGVYLIRPWEINNLYPVVDCYDSQSDELGHIPYTPDFFTALGTTVIRKIDILKRTNYKVIALDCDHTLWQGVCGEDGLEGIIIDESCRQLQSFMIEQKNQGMLLCLCSKNNEEDVQKVFEERSDMILKWTDFVAVRVNWQDKSSNLKSLSTELQLGLDSFIFIDDNPVECAEVKTNYPEVLILELPENRKKLFQFLNHVWVFDQRQVTIEDTQRSTFYLNNILRQQVLQNSLTLADFINSLNLQIEISSLNIEQISRVSQLTQRTNQFNATSIRQTENEIQSLLNLGYHCLTVKVKDRFGDYGLVGTMIYRGLENILKIDTFLLSCRTLGRGVEYQMIAELGKIALNKKLECLEIDYQPTEKNQPILNFLQRVGKAYQDGYCFRLPAIYASQMTYQPDTETPTVVTPLEKNKAFRKIDANSDLYNYIAAQLATPEQINRVIVSTFTKTQTRQNYVSPRNETETGLAKIWLDLLKVEKVGIEDNFFELGGDSILMIQIVARAKQAGLDITPMQLFEHPTIAELATVAKPIQLAQIENTKIVHSQASDAESYTPLDFPDVDLSQEELEHLLSSLE